MLSELISKLDRRTLLKTAGLVGVAQIASPFVITARAADEVKIGFDNPLTGVYAALGKNELIGAQLALEQINAKGGILGRKAELLVEDSTSGDAGTAVQKARKLIDRDKVNFLLGNINSALAAAMANVAYEKGVFHVVPGGHTDPVTGTNCHWNVFRICNTTQMEGNAVAGSLIKNAGKKWYLSDARLCVRPHAAGRPREGGGETRRNETWRRSDAARHHRLLLLPHQSAIGEPGRHHLPAGWRRRGECAEAGRAIRPRQALPPCRRAAGA